MRRQLGPGTCSFADNQLADIPRGVPLVFQGERGNVGRIINDTYGAPDKGKPRLVLLVHKADASCLVNLALLSMQKGVGDGFGIQKPERFLVAVVSGSRTDILPQGGMRFVLVAFIQPHPKQFIEVIQC